MSPASWLELNSAEHFCTHWLCVVFCFFFGCGCIWCVSKVYLKELSLQSLSLLWTHEYCTLAVNGKKKKIDYCQFWL